MVLVQMAWFDAVADRRTLLPLFCCCPDPASMSAPACQLFEFRAKKILYDPSRAILERAPLNLLIALTRSGISGYLIYSWVFFLFLEVRNQMKGGR